MASELVMRGAHSLCLLLALFGCGAPSVNRKEGPREYVATDYDGVLKRWTREESLILYDELERKATTD